MTKRRVPILSIVLYALAGLLVLYTIWALSESIGYINDAVAAGQLVVKGNGYTIINFYMSNCSQYAVFAVILFTLGWILQYFSRCKYEKSDCDCTTVEIDEDHSDVTVGDSGPDTSDEINVQE